MIDHVFFDANVPGQRVRDEAIREFLLFVEQTNHLLSRNVQHSGRGHRGGHFAANGAAHQCTLAEEGPRLEHRDDGFFAAVRQH